jgi:hypothetical protein
MGTFAETAVVNYRYRLLFADQGKQTSFPFGANKRKFLPFSVSSVFPSQKWLRPRDFSTEKIFRKPSIFPKIKRETDKETLAIFLKPFTVCSSCKRKFVVCPFIDEETNGSYPFANKLNGLSGLVHLCLTPTSSIPISRLRLNKKLKGDSADT